LLRPLIDQDLSVVFYDLTTVGVVGKTDLPGDVRAFGKSKDGGIARQFMLGVVQSAEGLPIAYRVWEGNTGETTTLQPMIAQVLAQFPVKRIVLVADRGLLSLDNLAQLQALTVTGGQPLEFVLAVPGRRYTEFDHLLEPARSACQDATSELVGEVAWQGLRLIWAHDPERAAEQSQARQARIDEIIANAQMRAGKLDAQDEGEIFRGRRLSDSGAKAWMFREVSEARLGSIIKVDLGDDAFSYEVDDLALARARLHDGKLLLVTNVPDLTPTEVVDRYKNLADIERGFKVLKSDIEIAPVFHRLPERIKAHALICFLALVLHRVLRMQLKDARSALSPQRVLEIARRIQLHQVTLPNRERAVGIGELDPVQREIFDALGLEIPTRQRLETAL
ncbi:MAG: IS1634 family transposase, partial [Gammaproteobacteria bacterium]